MSRPDDIPKDVWSAAIDAGSRSRIALFEISTGAAALWGASGVIGAMNEHFARAIMAERERCAVIAETCTIKREWSVEIPAAIRGEAT